MCYLIGRRVSESMKQLRTKKTRQSQRWAQFTNWPHHEKYIQTQDQTFWANRGPLSEAGTLLTDTVVLHLYPHSWQVSCPIMKKTMLERCIQMGKLLLLLHTLKLFKLIYKLNYFQRRLHSAVWLQSFPLIPLFLPLTHLLTSFPFLADFFSNLSPTFFLSRLLKANITCLFALKCANYSHYLCVSNIYSLIVFIHSLMPCHTVRTKW